MILSDIDDVALNWLGGFREFLQRVNISVNTDHPLSWDLGKWVNHHSVKDLVEEFNSSPAFEKLDPVEGAVKYLTLLSEEHEIVGITCCGIQAMEARQRNLRHVFGDVFTELMCLPLDGDKTAALKKYPTSWWIEDKFENAVIGANVGHISLLFDKSYNRGTDSPLVTRVSGWQAAYDLIKSGKKAAV